jgi:AcrR family transcriptional regulator
MLKTVKQSGKARNLEATRMEILQAAFGLVFQRGFQGVSVDDIVKETQYTKGAFYHLFPTKLDLGYALVDEVIKPMVIDRWISPLADYDNPLQGILAQMQRLIGDVDPAILKFGCPLNNLVQEMAPIDPGFEERLKTALHLWIERMEEHLLRGKSAGFIHSAVNTREAAYFVVMAHEGFYGMIKGVGVEGAFDALYRSMTIYFRAISAQQQ